MKIKNKIFKKNSLKVLSYDKSKINSIIKDINLIDKHKFKDIIDFKNLANQRFNCGVIYFNFTLYNQNNILNKLINLLQEINNNNIKILNTGTEKTFNIIVSKYKKLDDKFNKIIGNKVKIQNINFSENIIFHFKGKKDLLNDKTYIEILNKISL